MADSPVLTGEADREIVFEWLRNEYSNYGRVCLFSFSFSFSFILHMDKEMCSEWLRNEYSNRGRVYLPLIFSFLDERILFERM